MRKTLLLLVLLFLNFTYSQVGVNTTNPHVSAELDVSSTNKGLLVPRLTTSAIATLASTASEGLIVFDTDRKLFLGWDGTKWQVFGNVNPVTTIFAAWEFGAMPGGSGNFGTSPFSGTVNQISSATLTRGSGILTTGSGAAASWGGKELDATNLANAIAAGDYATISLVLSSTNLFSFSRISANIMGTSTQGPPNVQWQYSIDGGANYINVGSPISLAVGADTGVSEISLSSLYDLQNINNTTIFFRVVMYGALAPGGTWYIRNLITGNDLEIVGTVNN